MAFDSIQKTFEEDLLTTDVNPDTFGVWYMYEYEPATVGGAKVCMYQNWKLDRENFVY